jgi:flagellar hook-basal body complex protein FliE
MAINVTDAVSAYKQMNALGGMGGATKVSGGEGGFGDLLQKISGETIDSLKASEQATAAGAVGKANLTDVVVAVSNAEMTLQTVVAIRDRLISAYQEIIRMGV